MRLPPTSMAFTLLLGFLVALPSFGIDMSLPALTSIGAALGVAPERAGLMMSLFMLGFAVAPLFYGPVSDRYGRKPVVQALREAVRTVLDRPAYRRRASSMADEFSGIDTRAEILRIIGELAHAPKKRSRGKTPRQWSLGAGVSAAVRFRHRHCGYVTSVGQLTGIETASYFSSFRSLRASPVCAPADDRG